MRRFLLISSAALALAAPLSAQVTVSNGAPNTSIGPLGTVSGAPTAIAQTFVTSGGFDFLQSFTFFFSTFVDGSLVNYDASVYEFAADHLVGSALFSTSFTGTDSPSDEMLTFGTAALPLNVHLTSGTIYALVLSSLDGFATSAPESGVLIGATATDTYANGSLVVSLAGSKADLFTAGAFFTDPDVVPPDAAFSATFTNAAVTATPEPATLVLLATGFVGVAGVARRRMRSRG